MRQLFVIITLFLVVQTVTPTGQVLANTSTSQDTNPGQVRTTTQSDGTTYLTTEVNSNVTATSAPSTQQQQTSSALFSQVTGEEIEQPQGFANNLGSYLNFVLGFVIVVSLLLAFLNFIQAGIQWITSGGDKGKTEEARNKIVHAVIGILIVSSSFAVASFVAYILGFESINDALFSISRINPS